MFCMQCGTELPEQAKFCFKCGAQVGNADSAVNDSTIINLKCPECGATLQTNSSNEKIQCTFCGSEFIIPKKMNVKMVSDIDNLLKRGVEYLAAGHAGTAISYFNQVLDMDANNIVARNEIDKILHNTVFLRSKCLYNLIHFDYILELKYDRIDIYKKDSLVDSVLFDTISQIYGDGDYGMHLVIIRSKDYKSYNFTILDSPDGYVWANYVIDTAKGKYHFE